MAVLRWQQAEGFRHAVLLVSQLDRPQVDRPFSTLCGKVVTPRGGDMHETGGRWLDPSCVACAAAWLESSVTATGEVVGAVHVVAQPRPPDQSRLLAAHQDGAGLRAVAAG